MPTPSPAPAPAPQPAPAPAAVAAQQPAEGGSYTLDPATGALTLVQRTAPAGQQES